jgi:hypothetical protein
MQPLPIFTVSPLVNADLFHMWLFSLFILFSSSPLQVGVLLFQSRYECQPDLYPIDRVISPPYRDATKHA